MNGLKKRIHELNDDIVNWKNYLIEKKVIEIFDNQIDNKYVIPVLNHELYKKVIEHFKESK